MIGAIIALAGCASAGSDQQSKAISAGLDGYDDAAPTSGSASTPLAQVFADNAAAIDARDKSVDGASTTTDAVALTRGLEANPTRGGRTLDIPAHDGNAATSPFRADANQIIAQGPPADASVFESPDEGRNVRAAPTEALLNELAARILGEGDASDRAAQRDPLTAALRLSLLDALGASDLSSSVSASRESLPEPERNAVDAWGEALASLRDAAGAGAMDSPILLDAAQRLGNAALEQAPLAITRAVLARRVQGFGTFTMLPTPLLAGRSHPAGLYIELAGFSHTAASGPNGGAGFVVELGEEVSVYHEPDGLLAWRRPEQKVRDFSFNKRRDFYLVDRLDLPATLTVGSYRLKVRVRDKASDAQAEAIIPFDVVADSALVGSRN